MKMRLTQTVVSSLKPGEKPYWVSDKGCPNLRLYVGASGKVWYVQYRDERGRHQSYKIGTADALTVAQAREIAGEIKSKIVKGEKVKEEPPVEIPTLGSYLNDVYFKVVRQNHKSAEETIRKITVDFGQFFDLPIDELTPMMFEKWRTRRQADGAKTTTVNRIFASFKGALNWGIKRGLFENNPLQRLGSLKETDSRTIVRFLSDDERERLESALIERERLLQEKSNAAARGEFWDFLRPAVLLTLNIGVRRGTLFSLVWEDVDFQTQTLSLRGEISKNGKTARVPLNDDAIDILSSWRKQSTCGDNDVVFPVPGDTRAKKLDLVKRRFDSVLNAADIQNFRWHDMRHDFASQLVMRGVDLNTVRALLNHSDLKMTMRYAHLAPKQKLEAVQVLNRRTRDDNIIRLRKANTA
jgi:integrase